jgi:hypothetical protein
VPGVPRNALVDGAAQTERLAVHELSPAGASGAGSGRDRRRGVPMTVRPVPAWAQGDVAGGVIRAAANRTGLLHTPRCGEAGTPRPRHGVPRQLAVLRTQGHRLPARGTTSRKPAMPSRIVTWTYREAQRLAA